MISYQLSEGQPQKMSAGGVVLREVDGTLKTAVLVRWPHGSRNNSDRASYHLPKGTVEPGETLVEAALREIREEAGIVVELKKYIGTSVLPLRKEAEPSYRNRDNNEITINYFAALYEADTPDGMDHEHDEVLWLTHEEANQKLKGYWKSEDTYVDRAFEWYQQRDQAK